MKINTAELNKDALFADETCDYRIPAEPDAGQTVVLRFRTARDNVDRVSYIEENHTIEAEMEKAFSDSLFDYYTHTLSVGSECINYYFQIVKNNEVCYYNRLGATSDIQSCFSFRITPGFHTPEWAKGAVMYQIYVDRFCSGDNNNHVLDGEYLYIGSPVEYVANWSDRPAAMDVHRFHGGDLQGVWNKLDYLQDLGIEVIYLNPVFVSPSNHKYDCQDYDYVDPHYGKIVKDEGELLKPEAPDNQLATRYICRVADKENLEASNAFFCKLIEEIHRRGMKIIIDGVFNHCGSFNKWLDRELIYHHSGGYEPGAYISKDSPFRTFFKFYNEEGWPCNGNYDGWWGHDTLPKLNYEESPKLYEYIMKIARKWVSAPFHADGWRLDVAADLGHSSEFNHQFWRDFRKSVKSANPEAMILAEHYGDPSSWLEGDQWDTVMNYDAFMEPVSWFLTGMEKHSDEYNGYLYGDGSAFFRSMIYHMSRMQTPSLMVAMNELSNHDHSRFMTRTNRMVGRVGNAGSEAADWEINRSVFREGVMIQMTWPGAPTIYYGDETGVCGWTDPDNRRTFPWGKEDWELIEFHRYMIRMHKKIPALRKGSVKPLLADRQLIAYGRMYGQNRCIIVINNRSSEREAEIPVWQLGVLDDEEITRIMLTCDYGYNVGWVKMYGKDGILTLQLPANSGILLTTEAEEYL